MPSPLDLLMATGPAGTLAGIRRITAPDNSPLLTLVKAHLRISSTAEDALLQVYIDAAVEYIEAQASISLFNQKWQIALNSFPGKDYIQLIRGPVASIASFTIYDTANVPDATFSLYYLDKNDRRLVLNFGDSWPSTTLRSLSAVEVEYNTGYGTTTASLPPSIVSALLALVAFWYCNREAVNIGNIVSTLPYSVNAAIDNFKRRLL